MDRLGANDPAAATEAVTAALGAVAAEMEVRAAKATEKAKPVLEATAMLARDPSLLSTATGRIAEGEGPVDALYFAIEQYCELLASLGAGTPLPPGLAALAEALLQLSGKGEQEGYL